MHGHLGLTVYILGITGGIARSIMNEGFMSISSISDYHEGGLHLVGIDG